MMWATIAFVGLINIYGIRILPALQMLGGIMHIVFFIAIIIPLVLLSRRSSSEFVFTQLMTTEEGWQSNGVAWCLAMLTVTYCFAGK